MLHAFHGNSHPATWSPLIRLGAGQGPCPANLHNSNSAVTESAQQQSITDTRQPTCAVNKL